MRVNRAWIAVRLELVAYKSVEKLTWRTAVTRAGWRTGEMIASWDMFLVTTIGRTIVGLLTALMLGFLGYLSWVGFFPPMLAGLTVQTFTVVITMAAVVTFGTSIAWFKLEAEWKTRFVALALIATGACIGGWIGYDYGFDKGVAAIVKEYGHIPGGELRVPTLAGIRWSLISAALAANSMALGHHVWRLLRYHDPYDY